MRIVSLAAAAILAVSSPVFAQEQQAGNEASRNAEETFKKLVEKCDNTEALILRARIRLLINRTTDEAKAEGTKLLTQGFEECAAGKTDEAIATLKKAYAILDKGATEKFGQDATAKVKKAEAEKPAEAEKTDAKKPWWKFW